MSKKLTSARRFPGRKALLRHFSSLPQEIQPHFEHFADLMRSTFPLEVCLAYAFYRVEIAHRDTLYCGIVRLHHADADLVRRTVQRSYLARQDFKNVFKLLFSRDLDSQVEDKLTKAQNIRNKVMHGSELTDPEMREAIANVLDYSKAYNSFVKDLAGFAPFGNLRGILGKGKKLPKATTRLLLKGLELDLA